MAIDLKGKEEEAKEKDKGRGGQGAQAYNGAERGGADNEFDLELSFSIRINCQK